MDRDKLIKQLFIGKVSEILGFQRTTELLKEATRVIDDALKTQSASEADITDANYWKIRCRLAEKCLEETPCDPDIHDGQIKAWSNYHNFIGPNGYKI